MALSPGLRYDYKFGKWLLLFAKPVPRYDVGWVKRDRAATEGVPGLFIENSEGGWLHILPSAGTVSIEEDEGDTK